MKKLGAGIVITSIAIMVVLGWIVVRKLHVIDYYTVSTTANMPNLKTGSTFMASRLKKPAYGNFICFRNNVTQTIFIFKVMALPGDEIEIKDAVVYRNGNKVDEPNNWNEYLLSQKQYLSIAGFVKKNGNDMVQPTDSTYLVALSDNELQQYKIDRPRFVRAKGLPDTQLLPDFRNKGYNADNFGPIKIPADSYFVLGDDRHNALDSRYLGFVKAEYIVSTKLGD